MNIGAQDLQLLKGFVGEGGPASSPKFTVVAGRLDGNWIGGRGIAEWKGGVIRLNDIGSKAAQTVHRKLKSLAKQVWGPGTKKVLHDYEWTVKNLSPSVTLADIRKRRPSRKKKMTWANMLGPYGDKL
jgi:hypothetical protein